MRASLPFASLLLAGALGASACATVRCEESGGRPWREITTEHFVLKTDLSPGEAKETARALERFRSALTSYLGLKTDPPGRLTTIVFADPAALEAFGGGYIGYFHSGGDPLMVMISWPASWNVWRPHELLLHELTHYAVSFRLATPVPPWVSEGLAVYLETLELGPRGDRAIIGKDPFGYVSAVRWEQGPLSLQELWDWRGGTGERGLSSRGYASSWLWVRALMSGERERFQAFLARLEAGEEARAAWDAEFPAAVVDALAARVQRIPKKGLPAPKLEEVAVADYRGPFLEQAISAADFHVLAARLWGTFPSDATPQERTARGWIEMEKALRHEPGNLAARYALLGVSRDPEEHLAKARALAADYPASARAQLALATALPPGPERDGAIARGASLKSGEPWVLNWLAWLLVLDGRGSQALPLAEAAVAACPWSGAHLDTLAAALALSGRCDEALARQRRAVLLLQLAGHGADSAEFLERLRIYEEGCQRPPVQPAAPSVAEQNGR